MNSQSQPLLTATGTVAPHLEAVPGRDSRIRVLLADDHTILRETLANALRRQPDIDVVGEAGNGQAAVAMSLQLKPDIVLMDVRMPQLDGVAATRKILRELPSVRVIGLSMHDETHEAKQMLQAGAAAYMTKTDSTRNLVKAIRQCAAGTPPHRPSSPAKPD